MLSTLQMWLNVGVAVHPAKLFRVGVAIFFADDGPAVEKVLDRDEQKSDQNEDRGDFLVKSEEKSFNLEVIAHEPLEDLPEKGQRMGQAPVRSHDLTKRFSI